MRALLGLLAYLLQSAQIISNPIIKQEKLWPFVGKKLEKERMSVAVAEKVVCVTGGAGYIASWLVKLLLLRGYTVKATLRNPGHYHS